MKVAIFGGTFDPIHLGHLEVATAAADEFGLDRVLFIPAGRPPHKARRELAPYEDRFEMVWLACEGAPRFEASRLEEPGQGRPSYSIHTIERVREELGPDDRLFVILGADAFNDLSTWYRIDDVVRLAEFIVVSRPENQVVDFADARVEQLNQVDNSISASLVRDQLKSGTGCQALLPSRVNDYIGAKRLYVDGS